MLWIFCGSSSENLIVNSSIIRGILGNKIVDQSDVVAIKTWSVYETNIQVRHDWITNPRFVWVKLQCRWIALIIFFLFILLAFSCNRDSNGSACIFPITGSAVRMQMLRKVHLNADTKYVATLHLMLTFHLTVVFKWNIRNMLLANGCTNVYLSIIETPLYLFSE